MKALGVATIFMLALFLGIFVWALANDMPLAGEPTALLQIDNSANRVIARLERPSVQVGAHLSGGQVQVILDVAPNGKAGAPAARSFDRGTSEGLLEKSKYGPLPKRALDGRIPARAYARRGQHRPDTLPRIAVLVTGLGLNQRLSERAVKKLPSEISLAISVYGRRLTRLVSSAQSLDHELMLQVPMEPYDYPESDTGPKTLLAGKTAQENRSRLHWSLGRFTGYFGVVNNKGGRFLGSKKAAGGLFKELQRRGLVFFRDSASDGTALSRLADQIGLGYSQATLELDRRPSPQGIERALQKLEDAARRSGLAIGVAHMHPVSIDIIAQWAKKLESRGFHLVPVSAAYGTSRS